jgi:ACS family hexuronate transporter-like MFS transporter
MAARGARRWVPTAAMMGLSLLSYVDRNVLALLSPTILRETHLTAEDYGWIISAFSVAYLVGNPAWGMVIDRVGVRAGAAAAVTLWTLASASHAFAAGFGTFALARAVLGFGEGATFPAGLRTATQTLEPESRARGVALAYSGGSLGAILTPLIVTPVALRWGWRGAFLCTGLLGLAWLTTWSVVSRRADLRGVAQAHASGPSASSALPGLRLRSLVGFAAAYSLGALPIGLVLYGAPIHLGRGLGFDQATLGHVLWVPPLGWELGYFFWGWVLDRSRAPNRFARLLGLLAALALPFAATPLARSLPLVLALMFWGMFVASGFVIVSLSEVTHRHSARHGALLAGVGAGSWSGVVAVTMPIFGRLFDRGAYGLAYALATAAPVAGWLAWTALSRYPLERDA